MPKGDNPKESTGTITLTYKREVISKTRFLYNTSKRGKDAVIKALKFRYGKKFDECGLIIENDPIKEKVYVNNKIRVRTRKKIPEYFIYNLQFFETGQLKKLNKIVIEEINQRGIKLLS